MRGLRSGIGSGQLVLVVFVALTAGCQPADERPGLWLSGEVEVGPVGDWSFTNEIEEIFVETRTWYGLPHSVTIWGAAQGGHFYLPSLYYAKEEYPDARYWNRNVVRDPRVRVEIGDRIIEGAAELVTDESELDGAMQAFAQKYPTFDELRQRPDARWIMLRFAPGSAD
jgi:hypothetical protein